MKRLIAIREEIKDLTDDVIEFAEEIMREEMDLDDYIFIDSAPVGWNYSTDDTIENSFYCFDYVSCNDDAFYRILNDNIITDKNIEYFNEAFDNDMTKEEFLEIIKDNKNLFQPFDEDSYDF